MGRFRKSSALVLGGALLTAGIAAWAIVSMASPSPEGRAPSRSDAADNPGENNDRPNILVIVTDDQRWDSLATMPKTRRWFGRGGTRFTRALVTTPTCCPARASIWTGNYSHNHGVLDTRGPRYPLDHSRTLQKYLSEAGYRTGIFGKYLNRWPKAENPPYFDEWAIFNDVALYSYYGGTWNVNGQLEKIDSYSTDYVQSSAVDFIRDAGDDPRPWFMYVTPLAPHEPTTAAPKYANAPVPPWKKTPALWEEDLSDKPSYLELRTRPRDEVRRLRKRQVRSLMSVDDMVDSILVSLRDSGQLSDTLAIFTSDNGYNLGEQGVVAKRYPYSASVRVPMLARWPGHFEKGLKDDRLVANIDLAPTIFEATSVDPQHSVDGRSLLAPDERDEILLEMWSAVPDLSPPWAALLSRNYEYVEYYDEEDGEPIFREYYDLARDPWQLDNLLAGGSPSGLDIGALSLRLERISGCMGTEGDEDWRGPPSETFVEGKPPVPCP